MPITVKLTIENYRAMREKNGHVWLEDQSLPKNAHEKTWWIAPCGHRYFANYNKVQQGRTCGPCSRRGKAGKKPKTEADYRSQEDRNGHVWLDGQALPKNVKAKSRWLAPCGHEILSSYDQIDQGGGCQVCAHQKQADKIRLTEQDYRSMFQRNAHQWMEGQSLPLTTHEKTWWLAPCGHTIYVNYNNIYNGQSCSLCAAHKLEREVGQILADLFPDVKHQVAIRSTHYPNALWYDYGIPERRIMIEYHGRQHYTPVCFGGISLDEANKRLLAQEQRDRIKVEWCQQNDYHLIVIPYWIKDLRTYIMDMLQDAGVMTCQLVM